MVILAASVVTKSGKALVSRQFVDMTRIRIEGLLAAFPKLVGSGKQHTYVETENVRYVYQPLEGLFLVLVTNKQSNILEDLDTLRLLSKVVPEYCSQILDEETVSRNAFELIFAFDEVISVGHKENVTLQQVRTYTEMESHEEKLHKMIIQSKINDTKDHMKRRAMEIEKTKVETKSARAFGNNPMSAVSSSGFGGSGASGNFFDDEKGPSARDSYSSGPRAPIADEGFSRSGKSEAPKASVPMKGMVLGKGPTKTNAFLESLRAEGEAVEAEAPAASKGPAAATSNPVAAAAALAAAEPVTIVIEEKLLCQLKKDGGMESMEVQGTMMLEVSNDDDAFCRVHISGGQNKALQFKTHPNIDKALHANSNVLGLKDASRPFPTGSALGILKWRMQAKDESSVPLSINCWPSVSGSQSYVSIEYEASQDMDLQNVVIAIPLPALRDPPQVTSCDGDYKYDARRSVIEWQIDLIDSTNRAGSMEFVVPAADSGVFFPIDARFSSKTCFADIKVDQVTRTTDNAPIKFSCVTRLVTDSCQVA